MEIDANTWASIWVAVALVIFLGGVAYYGGFKVVTKALDDRAANISSELEEARKLREDAQALLASYKRKQMEAEKEAEDIVAQAKGEAERMKAETEAALADQLERRTKAAEQKIESAETQALNEVRSAATDVAIAAAAKVIATKVDGAKADQLVAEAINELGGKLH